MKLKIGDVFTAEVQPEKYIFGRIIFDIKNQYVKTRDSEVPTTHLSTFGKSYIVQTFEGIYDSRQAEYATQTVIDSAIMRSKIFKNGHWEISGNLPVDVEKVSFPETLARKNNVVYFECGELSFELPVSASYTDEIKIYPTMISPVSIYAGTLHYQGLDDYIDKGHIRNKYLEGSDLRYRPEIRTKIYEMIGEDMNQTYYEMALKHGYDLKRLYK